MDSVCYWSCPSQYVLIKREPVIRHGREEQLCYFTSILDDHMQEKMDLQVTTGEMEHFKNKAVLYVM